LPCAYPHSGSAPTRLRQLVLAGVRGRASGGTRGDREPPSDARHVRTGARPHPPRALYRAYLEQSDVVIGLYWERYGWVASGDEISGLEDEYGLSGDRPKLIYINTPSPRREQRLAKLQRHAPRVDAGHREGGSVFVQVKASYQFGPGRGKGDR
jgi:Domain of unknown function (DUF4062)